MTNETATLYNVLYSHPGPALGVFAPQLSDGEPLGCRRSHVAKPQSVRAISRATARPSPIDAAAAMNPAKALEGSARERNARPSLPRTLSAGFTARAASQIAIRDADFHRSSVSSRAHGFAMSLPSTRDSENDSLSSGE
jgi:hypothetical protein